MVHGRARIYIDEAFAYLRFGMVVFTCMVDGLTHWSCEDVIIGVSDP